GKSLLGQQLCTAVASGLRFLGIEARACPALYVTCEDDVDELHRRQHAINRSLRTRYAGLDGKLHLVSLVGNEDNAIARVNGSGELR
ncbi:AAA family ATPase, partial [Acinetobacter baumannii]